MLNSIRSVSIALAGVLALAVSPLAVADDTEVFLAQVPPGEESGANILFIIDNSGSMDTELQTQAEWNPATTYSGCYLSDALYFASGTQPPPCGSTAYLNKSANRCAASAAALDSVGQYSGRVLAWDESRELWEALANDQADHPVECEADRGLDGDGPGSEVFAANGPEGPWSPDESQEPAWNSAVTLFDGNRLNWSSNPPMVTRTRLQVVQDVLNDILDTVEGVNVGLMQFNDEEGGAVIHAVEGISTARDDLKAAVNGMSTLAFTPLSETLYEAALYFRGGNVDYGNIGPVRSVAAARVGNDPNGAQYRTPIAVDCQKNFVVLLTDGEPSDDVGANNKIRNLPGFNGLIGTCDGAGDGACLDDLAEYLFRSDASGTLGGTQTISTYVIGFSVDAPLLESTAERGGGQYYLADDTGSLANALTDVITGIVRRASVFAAPAIPVSAFGLTPDERDVYVSVFEPTDTAHWPGNLKKYQLTEDGLLGQDGALAINPLTGFFAGDATSFWSAAPDGDRVIEGGAANRLPVPTIRKVYTDLAGPDLTDTDNRVAVGNALITDTLLGVPAGLRTTLINWIRGVDALDIDEDNNVTERRLQMGDPLHVRPVALSYGASAANPDTIVFVSTNDGFLHAVDADTGVEIWSYVPGRLLPRQYQLYLDGQTTARGYGLDGEIRLFRGAFADGTMKSVLIFGMGRGGDAVFALDVTSRDSPVLLWQIDSSSPGFASLGQTWAAPPVARIETDGGIRPVLVLSGGYDDSQDNRGYRTDNVGNAMFIVDLETGERLWSGGAPDGNHDLDLPDMEHSIPAAPRVLDLSGDGLADRFYVGDTGGRLWRFDILNGNGRVELVEAGVLASLGAADLGAPPASAVRRFYNTPDAVFVNCIRGTFLAINIGSGYRGHPLDTDVDDAFFSVRDANVYLPIATGDYPEPISADELLDITTDPTADVPVDAKGWRLRMVEDDGEKILTSAITFDNRIFFNSFSPGAQVNACVGGLGINRAYQVDACNGRPVTNLDGSTEPGPLSTDDRFRRLNQTSIASETVLLLDYAGTTATECIGLECFQSDEGSGASTLPRTYWAPEIAR